jgi:TATA-binding protein-associated factor
MLRLFHIFQEEVLQDKAADALAELIFSCVSRKPGPNDKLIKNICLLACSDASETPQATVVNSMQVIEDQNLLSIGKHFISHKSRGHMTSGSEERLKTEGFISCRGSELALMHLCEKFGSSLFEKLPKLWDCLTEFLKPVQTEDDVIVAQLGRLCEDKEPQSLINNTQVCSIWNQIVFCVCCDLYRTVILYSLSLSSQSQTLWLHQLLSCYIICCKLAQLPF